MTDGQTNQLEPRRLVPQRRSKPAPSATDNSINKSEPIPIDLSLDAAITHDIHDDDAHQITRTMADWTLDEALKIEESRAMSVDDDTSEEQSYHGEIESHESSEEEEASLVSQETIAVPEGYSPISLDDISTTPPPSSPLVLVNLQSLCGYKPHLTEREALISQITDALYADTNQEADDDVDNNGEGLEFDAKVLELFESGVGSHVESHADVVQKIKALNDKSSNDDAAHLQQNEIADDDLTSMAIISYPEFISDSTTLQSTARLWKLLHTPHPMPLIERIFGHLRNTSQSLIWKARMHNELRDLVVAEYKVKMRRLATKEYEEWKAVRKEKLEKLYEVRETILLRVDVARERYEKHVEDRERRVDVEMTRRRGNLWVESKRAAELERQTAPDDPFDNDHYESHDDDGWDGAIREEDVIGASQNFVSTEYFPDEEEDGSDREEWAPVSTNAEGLDPVGMSVVVKDSAQKEENTQHSEKEVSSTLTKKAVLTLLEAITTDDNKKRMSRRLDKTAQQSKSCKAMEDEEAEVREKLKTTDELMAEAMLQNLQERLDSVDNLLESIQEEEWADEEDADELEQNDVNSESDEPNTDSSVLDLILAMILGKLSPHYTGAASAERHFKLVKEEHDSIVAAWIETFGRLPPSANQLDSDNFEERDFEKDDVSAEKLRAIDNNDKNWDEADWDTLMP